MTTLDPNYVEQVYEPVEYKPMVHEKPQFCGDYERNFDGGGSQQQQRSRNDGRDTRVSYDFNESIKIKEASIGRIIGQAGSNINRIQSDFQCRVDIDKMNLTVHVRGHLERNVQDAIERIRGQVDTGGGQRERYGDGGGNRDRYDDRGDRRDRRNDWHGNNRRDGNSGDFRERRGNDRDLHGQRRVRDAGYNFGGDSRKSGGGYGNYRQLDSAQKSSELATGGDLTGIIDWDAINKQSLAAQAERWAKCPEMIKVFYKEDSQVANLSAEEVARIRAENNNTAVSRVFQQEAGVVENMLNPVWTFEQCFKDYPDLLEEIMKQGFQKPSPIQAQAWPILMSGNDMIGIAQTGTGKTLAFLLPAMIHTEYQTTPRGQRGGANVLVLAPTRELALQIEMEVTKYSFRNMKAVCVYGGGDRKMQISDVERGAEIIICTPGRLNDLVQANVIDLASITYLVLDEADRMLDMGFEPQIRKVLLDIRPDRQTVMTSATWPPGVRRLAQSYMKNPIQVCIGSLDLAATHSVKQVIEIISDSDDNDKYDAIKNFLKNMQRDDKVIVFCGRKARADDLSSDLTLEGFMTQCIHGNRDQRDREQAISDIKSGYVKILIATDVASRGLDIEDITHVINYDFPRNIEEYVHRVGRTGRAGRTGISISYITREDWAVAKELIDILEEAGQEVPEELRNMARRFTAMKEKRASLGGGFRRGRGGGGRIRY